MAWVKLDDSFATHPKVMEAGPLAMAMQVAALCYANRHLTDGLITTAAMRTLLDLDGLAFVGGMQGRDASPDMVAALLVDAEMWHEPGHDCPECADIDRGFVIHGYLDFQPSRAQTEAKKKQASDAGRRGGKAKAKRAAKRSASEPLSEPSSGSEAEDVAESCPDPVPVPLKENTRSSDDDPSSPETLRLVSDDQDEKPLPSSKIGSDDDPHFVAFWKIYPRKVGKGQARKAWRAAIKIADLETIIGGAERYRDHPGREAEFTAHPSSWLAGERWGDDLTLGPPKIASGEGRPRW